MSPSICSGALRSECVPYLLILISVTIQYQLIIKSGSDVSPLF